MPGREKGSFSYVFPIRSFHVDKNFNGGKKLKLSSSTVITGGRNIPNLLGAYREAFHSGYSMKERPYVTHRKSQPPPLPKGLERNHSPLTIPYMSFPVFNIQANVNLTAGTRIVTDQLLFQNLYRKISGKYLITFIIIIVKIKLQRIY